MGISEAQQSDQKSIIDYIPAKPRELGPLGSLALRVVELQGKLKAVETRVDTILGSLIDAAEELEYYFEWYNQELEESSEAPCAAISHLLSEGFGYIREDLVSTTFYVDERRFGLEGRGLESLKKGAVARAAIVSDSNGQSLSSYDGVADRSYIGAYKLSSILGDELASQFESAKIDDQGEAIAKQFDHILNDDLLNDDEERIDLLKGFKITVEPGYISDLGGMVNDRISVDPTIETEALILSIQTR